MADVVSPWKPLISMSPGSGDVNPRFLPRRERSLSASILQQFNAQQPQKLMLHKFRASSLAVLATVHSDKPAVSQRTDRQPERNGPELATSKQVEVLLGQIKCLLYIHNLLKMKHMKQQCKSHRKLTERLKNQGEALEDLQKSVTSIHERLNAHQEILGGSQESLHAHRDFQREVQRILEVHTEIMIQQKLRIEHLSAQLNHSCLLEVGCLVATLHLLHQPITALLVDGLVHLLHYWFPRLQHRRKLEQLSKLMVLVQFYVLLRCSSRTRLSTRLYCVGHRLVSWIWQKHPTALTIGLDSAKLEDVQMSSISPDTQINDTNYRISRRSKTSKNKDITRANIDCIEDKSSALRSVGQDLKASDQNYIEARHCSKTSQTQEGLNGLGSPARNGTISHQMADSVHQKSVLLNGTLYTVGAPGSKEKSAKARKTGKKKRVTFVDI